MNEKIHAPRRRAVNGVVVASIGRGGGAGGESPVNDAHFIHSLLALILIYLQTAAVAAEVVASPLEAAVSCGGTFCLRLPRRTKRKFSNEPFNY